MKEAELPKGRRGRLGVTDYAMILRELHDNPNTWYDITDDVPHAKQNKFTGSTSALQRAAGRLYTPLEVTQRAGKLFARWNHDKH